MNVYLAHGLTIQSERALPPGVERVQGVGPFDLTIVNGSVDWDREADFSQGLFRRDPLVQAYSWPEIGRISINRDGRVVVDAKPTAPEGLVEHVLLGPILASWFVGQGRLPLHASCVHTENGLVAIVGPSGAGKSTLAAALVRQGANPHGDDLISVCPKTASTPYGTARNKLNPDSLQALNIQEETLGLVFSGSPKRAIVQESPRSSASLLDYAPPLRAIYRLVDSNDELPQFERLTSMKAAFGLMMDVFMVDIQTQTLGPQALLKRCSSLASVVPLFLLRRKKSLTQLGQLAEALLNHSAQLKLQSPEVRDASSVIALSSQ